MGKYDDLDAGREKAMTSAAEQTDADRLASLLGWVVRTQGGAQPGEGVAEYLEDITRRGVPLAHYDDFRAAAEAYCVQWIVRDRCQYGAKAIGYYLDDATRRGMAISRIPRLRDRCRAEWRKMPQERTT